MRRTLGLDGNRREAAERIAQGLDDGIGSSDPRGVHREPTPLAVDPRACDSPPRERSRTQLIGHAGPQIAHLLASDRKALLLGLYFSALLSHLPDDRSRKQFLIVAQRDHVLLIDGMQQAAAARDRYPSTVRHLERSAGLQSAARKLTFEIRGSRRPFCGQTMENQILEQHEPHPRKGSADYMERAPHCKIPKAVFVKLAQY